MAIEALIQIDHGSGWLHLTDPVRLIHTNNSGAVIESIERAATLARREGWFAVGYVKYEAGAAFGLSVRDDGSGLPLVWFALFDSSHVRRIGRPEPGGPYAIDSVQPSIDREQFLGALARIKDYIADGDTYQVNFTFRMRGAFRGDPQSLFVDLTNAQQGRYSAFIRMGDFSVCSASPELFFSHRHGRVEARPMKGTARRGRTLSEDVAQVRALRTSAKERAENVMIVDMVRNDLGRIAETGSIQVPSLYSVERYPTVWQMTSTVTGRASRPLEEIFAAVHPAASVTGAPKVRTMQIVRELEHEPRGIYTGSIGYVEPGGAAQFNVAIRTAVIDHRVGVLEFGVGSGVVWDSDAAKEYEECLLKGAVLGRRDPQFDLLETLRWTPEERFFLLERHLHRLQESARYFGFRCRLPDVREALERAVAAAGGALRIRLLVGRDGGIRTEASPLELSTGTLRVGMAAMPIDPADPFLFHKTTNRPQQERERSPAYDEMMLWNPAGEITEAMTANIVVDLDGRAATPPVECGLLAGTLRAELLAAGKICEARITVDQLRSSPRFWLINSVRGWRPAVLDPRLESDES